MFGYICLSVFHVGSTSNLLVGHLVCSHTIDTINILHFKTADRKWEVLSGI